MEPSSAPFPEWYQVRRAIMDASSVASAKQQRTAKRLVNIGDQHQLDEHMPKEFHKRQARILFYKQKLFLCSLSSIGRLSAKRVMSNDAAAKR
jgi:hypothetical protein